MGMTASAGKTGFSQEKNFPSKCHERRGRAAAPGPQELQVSISRDTVVDPERFHALKQQLLLPSQTQHRGNCFTQGLKKRY